MKKHSRMLSSIAVAAVFLGAGPAGAHHGTPVYGTRYYSDAAHTNQVGQRYWIGCDWWTDEGQFMVDGQMTVYSEDYLTGYCYNGNMEPF